MRLEMRFKDVGYIVGVGLFFSLSLSLLCYVLLEKEFNDGIWFGLILGTCLSFFAIISTLVLNRYFLPLISSQYWIFLASLFSFLSGFIGTCVTYFLCIRLHVKMLLLFENHFMLFGLFIGMMSFVVAYLLYQFITISKAQERQEKLLTQSRLKSLEQQLNPHFLFNALNSLAELLHVNPIKAEKTLLQLSLFLRSSMKEEALICLCEEMENVIRYVALENIRFDDNIVLIHDIPLLFNETKVPKFSLQLIVENAIKHGYKREKLTISIDIKQKKKLEITICNDGLPIVQPSFGIGLQNLQERLALLCHGELILQNELTPTFILSIGDPN